MPTDPPPRSSHPASKRGQAASPPHADTTPAADRTGPAPDSPSSLQLTAGAEPVADYRLVRPLGKGGFGEVWEAVGPGGFPVALKFVRLAEKVAVAEQRALELMKQLRHPNLLGLHGAWSHGAYLVLAMELAERTLLDRLNEAVDQGNPGIPFKELLRYMRQAAEGIDYLNEQEVQHRDVKPHNLLLVGGAVKVGDFGLAKVLQHTVASATGSMTASYASPEVCNDQLSRWSDQYSLAVTYCQLRGNHLPFEGPLAAVVAGHMMGTPDLSMMPEAERPVLERALAKKPQERFPSCMAFVAALAAAARTRPATATATTTRTTVTAKTKLATPTATTTRTAVDRPPAPAPPRRALWPLVVGGLALLAAVGILIVALIPRGEGKKDPSKDPRVSADSLPDKASKKGDQKPPTEKKQDDSKPPIEKKDDPKPSMEMKKDDPKLKDLDKKPGPDDKGPGGKDAPVKKGPEHVEPVVLPPSHTNSLGMKLVLIYPGKFLMGSPKTEVGRIDDEEQHEVQITRPFYLGKFEVTRGQFAAFVQANKGYKTDAEKDVKIPPGYNAKKPVKGGHGYNAATGKLEHDPLYSWRNTGFKQTDQHPVVNVSWHDAVAFCQWLSKQEGKSYRLPTEAEWEYACRAGTKTRFHSGNDPETLVRVANIADASAKKRFPSWKTIKADDGYAFTAPVGQFQPNTWGLHDMHGNAWEWCHDWRNEHYYKVSPRQDPKGPGVGVFRVTRGGNWGFMADRCRAAFRDGSEPSYRLCFLGFRVVLEP